MSKVNCPRSWVTRELGLPNNGKMQKIGVEQESLLGGLSFM